MRPPPSRSGFLHVRRILSLDPRHCGNALWWQDGKIEAVGEVGALATQVPAGTPHFAFPDALLTPGFVDSHTHFSMWALGGRQVQLFGARSVGEAVERVARAIPEEGWVVGQGWDANAWASPPDKLALDRVQSGPVFLDSVDVHSAWVNSAALRLAGIDRDRADPPGGRIVRDASGEPTGLLLERAVELVRRMIPEVPRDRMVAAMRAAQAEAHRLGVTAIHNVEGHAAFDAFAQLEADDALRLRVLFHHPVAELSQIVSSGVRSGTGTEWLTHGGIKMFLDGSLGSRTAWMLQPYEGSRDRGMAISEETTVAAAMRQASTRGLACVVHAIGDAAVRRALTLMETLPPVAIRHRIEHFQCFHPDDLRRAAARGIVLSMQPAHLLTDIPIAERHWGRRSAGAYAFQSLLQAGSVLAFGSDTPVASIDPREGVFAAMERRQDSASPPWYPGERLDFETVVRAYTLGPALAAGVAARRGTLAAGSDADLVVWDVDPGVEHGNGSAFRAGRARLTVVDGEVVAGV
jgi:predicted amidohydrolase YtcJ